MPRHQGTPAGRSKEHLERDRRMLEMRFAGHTYEEIGRAEGVSTTTAFDDVQAALRNVNREQAEGVLALELERLDKALLAIWPRMQQGHLPSIDRVLAIMNRRTRFLGLDAPTKAVGGWMGADGQLVDPDVLWAEASERVERLRAEGLSSEVP